MSDDDFERLLRLLIRYNALTRPAHAESFAEDIARWQREFTKSQQKSGLRDALCDTVEMSYDLPPVEVSRIDAILRSEGLPGIHALRLEHGRKIRRLLKKKKLALEEDVYALKGMLDSGLLNADDVEKAEALVGSFSR